jgi:hypothetical protein
MVIGLALKYTIGIRVTEADEQTGLDMSLHDESAYDVDDMLDRIERLELALVTDLDLATGSRPMEPA